MPAPLSPYAVSKLAGEHYCRSFARIYGFDAVCLRYFNVFGPRQDPSSEYSAVIPRFIRLMMNGQRPIIYGDGKQTRDFTYVQNVVHGNLLACEADEVSGEVFNIACGKRYSLLDLIVILNDILGTRIDPVFAPPRPGDAKHSLADIQLAQEGLGYKVDVDFVEGLEKTVAWYREQGA